MDTLRAIEHAPGHLVQYLWGLLGAILDDFAMITLTIFVVLLGLLTSSVLIAATAFFGSYFVLRLVSNVAESIGYTSRSINQGQQMQAQATMQVAAALTREGVADAA